MTTAPALRIKIRMIDGLGWRFILPSKAQIAAQRGRLVHAQIANYLRQPTTTDDPQVAH